MLMVVVFHVSYMCFGSKNVLINIFNAQLELPLFFMISGFFAANIMKRNVLRALGSRFMELVMPALLMLLLFCMVKDVAYQSALCKMLKDGYWFTLVLFEFVVIYTLVASVLRFLNITGTSADVIHLLVGVMIIYVAAVSEHYNASYALLDVFTVTYFGYYFYYVAGSVLFKRKALVNKLLSNSVLCGGGYFALHHP